MENKNYQHKTIHQRLEAIWQHRLSVTMVAAFMFIGILSLDSRIRHLAQDVYAQGWGWIGTYLHHEHPPHLHEVSSRPKISTISGPAS